MSREYTDVTREGGRTFVGRRRNRRVTIRFQNFKVNGQSIGNISATRDWDAAGDVEFVLPEINIVTQTANTNSGSGRRHRHDDDDCLGCGSGCSGRT